MSGSVSSPLSPSPSPSVATLLEDIRLRLARAEAAEQSGDPVRFIEGLSACAEALARLNETPADDLLADRLGAAVWLKRGHLLEARAAHERRPEEVIEALRGYDIALRLLEKHARHDAESAVVQAGAWLNRGNALLRLGTDAARAEAVRSYALAIAELTPRVAERPELRGNLAAARINLALARRAAGRAAEAMELLREALAGLAGYETEDSGAAAAGLCAREAAVEILIAQVADEGHTVTDTTRERVVEAATLVGEGLELLRALAARATPALRAPGLRLFAHGASLYSNFGDGQLAPYLAVYADAAEFPERAGPARAAIARARAELMARGFEELADGAAEQLAALREVEARLPRDPA